MTQMISGSMRLFRAFGIQVYLHWTWFILFYFLVQRPHDYSSPAWQVAEVLSIFAIVVVHEFGHALACRSVGGRSEHIVLWPLGGVAYVQPPHRPGAVLWSIVAGPLVNVVLIPVTYAVMMLSARTGNLDVMLFAEWLFIFNIVILVFNMLPIYPLDGGKVVQSLLWFVLGFGRSLRIATAMGLVLAVAGGAWALMNGALWLVLMAAFAAMNAWSGYKQSQMILAYERQTAQFRPPVA